MRSTASSSSARSSRYSSASSAEPLIGQIADDEATPPFVYAAVHSDGERLAEAALVHESSLASLRALVTRSQKALRRNASFCSSEERVRGSRAGVSGAQLPSTLSVHILQRHGHAFSLLSLPSLEPELASRFCEEVCSAFASMLMARERAAPAAVAPPALSGRWSARIGRPSRRQSDGAAGEDGAEFGERLRELLAHHARPERLARHRRVASVLDATGEVAGVMEEAVDRMLANAQAIDVLEDKSEWLLAQASAFQRRAGEHRRRWCCRNLKLTLVIGALALLLAGGLTLTLLWHFGVIFSGGGGGGGGGENQTDAVVLAPSPLPTTD
jgi:hypothetical protein